MFAEFSPKDTLCGDLNRGSVPVNPLGQSITDQPYPFELIKNKTLQFLARALPVLKSEYESIPKVARYLPVNHVLNPTHHYSPLTESNLQAMNQRLYSQKQPAYTLVGNDNFDGLSGLHEDDLNSVVELGGSHSLDHLISGEHMIVPQSNSHHSGSGSHDNGGHNRWRRWAPLRSGEYIAERSPNASLVVLSSAHTYLHRDGTIPTLNGSLAHRYHVLHNQLKMQQQQEKQKQQQRNSSSSEVAVNGQKVSLPLQQGPSNTNSSAGAFAGVGTGGNDASNSLSSALLQGRSSDSQTHAQTQSQLHSNSQTSVSDSPALSAKSEQQQQASSAQNGPQDSRRQSSSQSPSSSSSSGANCNEWNGITSA